MPALNSENLEDKQREYIIAEVKKAVQIRRSNLSVQDLARIIRQLTDQIANDTRTYLCYEHIAWLFIEFLPDYSKNVFLVEFLSQFKGSTNDSNHFDRDDNQ